MIVGRSSLLLYSHLDESETRRWYRTSRDPSGVTRMDDSDTRGGN